MTERSVIRQFRIYSRKPGEQDFRFRKFPGCQTTGDEPLACERLLRARVATPEWEFELAIREIVTVTTYGSWEIPVSTAPAAGLPPEMALRDAITFWLPARPPGWTVRWIADQTGAPEDDVLRELETMEAGGLVRQESRGRKTTWSLLPAGGQP